jgi:chemotaxis signal transduction protein
MKSTARTLREEFDASFAAAAAVPVAHRDVLEIVIGGDRHALLVSEIAGIFVDRAITQVPSRRPDLVGIVGFRGAVVPVFDLAAILGYTAAVTPRWMVLVSAAPIALAFDRFAGHVRVPRSEVSDAVVIDGQPVSLIAVASIARSITSKHGRVT